MLEKLEEIKEIQDSIVESIINITDWLLKYDLGEISNGDMKAEYNEYRRLSFRLPRRCGNTTIASKIMKHYDNSVLFSFNVCMAENFANIFDINRKRVFGIQNKNQISGLRFDVAIVDPASMINKSLIESLYFCRPKAIILLG